MNETAADLSVLAVDLLTRLALNAGPADLVVLVGGLVFGARRWLVRATPWAWDDAALAWVEQQSRRLGVDPETVAQRVLERVRAAK